MYIAESRRRIPAGRNLSPHTRKERAFDGLYVYYRSGDGTDYVNTPLSEIDGFEAEKVYQMAKRGAIAMIRLATADADLWYDLKSYKGISQRAGVATSRPDGSALAWLISGTNYQAHSIAAVRKVLAETIAGAKKCQP